jgi:hypothetical protein
MGKMTQFYIDLVNKRKGILDQSWDEIGKKYGLTGEAVRNRAKRMLAGNLKESTKEVLEKHGIDYQGTSSTENLDFQYVEKGEEATLTGVLKVNKTSPANTDRKKILEEFLKEHKVDMELWEVKEFRIGASDVTMSGVKSSTNQDACYTNYNIRVILKPKSWVLDKDRFVKELIQDVTSSHSPKVDKVIFNNNLKKRENNIFIPIIADAHIGRFSWGEETTEDYDLKIAKKNYLAAFYGMIHQCRESISEVLYVIGNDFYNSDHFFLFNKTTAGTPQENDSRWQKMFREGRQIAYETIDFLYKNVAPVKIVIMPGNHDTHFTYFLGQVLKAKYVENKNVTCSDVDVDVSPLCRKYHVFGKNLFGFAHGKNEKINKIHNIMSVDAKEHWGNAKYKYMFLGHTHHFEQYMTKDIYKMHEDYMGVEIIHMPSIANRDNYEQDKCFIGSQKGAKAFVGNYEEGIINTIHYNF